MMEAAVVHEGDLSNGSIGNINISDVGEDISKVIVDAKSSTMRFYATNNPSNMPMAIFLDVQAGQTVTKTANEFVAAVGFGNGNSFLNVQNIGGNQGSWKITFEK